MNLTGAAVDFVGWDSESISLNATYVKGADNKNSKNTEIMNGAPITGWPSRNSTFGYMLWQSQKGYYAGRNYTTNQKATMDRVILKMTSLNTAWTTAGKKDWINPVFLASVGVMNANRSKMQAALNSGKGPLTMNSTDLNRTTSG